MFPGHEVLLILLSFFTEILGTLSGFGSSVLFVPAAVFLEEFKTVLVLTSMLHVFGNISKLFLFRGYLSIKTFLLLILPTVLFTGVGAWVVDLADPQLFRAAFGVVLILFSLLMFFRKKIESKINKSQAIVFSSISGFLTGFFGTGGAIRGVALFGLGLSAQSFIVTSAAIDIFGDVLRAGIYLKNGYLKSEHFFYLPIFIVITFLASWIGKIILKKITQKQFEKIVLLMIAVSGLIMLFS
ncbi:MAG: sulfite exporter TauE/SafE family protein [Xanthomonadaceae bacterium]|nr:sulfite exporter TauE/SafE family protein [Xanthomonadaceae bacterium]